jgi:hypothetical protein
MSDEAPIQDDVFRWLCTALLKATSGEPVTLTADEQYAAFDVAFTSPAGCDDMVVRVSPGEDEVSS